MLSMAPIYASLIKKKIKTIENVPEVVVDDQGNTLRQAVEELLAEQ